MRKILIAMMFVSGAMLGARAATETVNGITWTYTVTGDHVSVGGGSSNSTAVPKSTSGVITIPFTLGGKSVTSIGDNAFSGCSGLTSVTIPYGVTSIGVAAFSGCGGLTSVTIPNSVTNIGRGAFLVCSGLTSVTIPDSVTSIGRAAFSGCSGLTSVIVPQCVCSSSLSSVFPSYQSITNVVISDSVTSIGEGAFSGCSSLTSVTVPNSVTNIEDYAFDGCSGLTSVIVPQYVCSSSLSSVFPSYQSITNVVIADGVTSIGSRAFSDCSGLTSFTIPDSVTNIGSMAFDMCPESLFDTNSIPCLKLLDGWAVGLSEDYWNIYGTDAADAPYLNLDFTNLKGVADGAFMGVIRVASLVATQPILDYGVAAMFGPSVSSVTIAEGVTNVWQYSLSFLPNLTNVSIAASVENIDHGSFDGCWQLLSFSVADGNARYSSDNGLLLENGGRTLVRVPQGRSPVIVVPDGVTDIAPYAFEGCNLQSVAFPASVDRIDTNAFMNCIIGRMVFEGNAPEVNGECFENFSVGMTYVTQATTGWSDLIPGDWMGLPLEYKDAVLAMEYGILIGIDMKGMFEIDIPMGVTRITSSAFASCDKLEGVRIPASVTHIEQGAFDGCPYYFFDTTTIPGVKMVDGWVVGLSDDYWNLYGNEDKPWYLDLTSARGIADHALEGARSLVSVNMSKSVRIIGDLAFAGCGNLNAVQMGDNVERIGRMAFDGCSESLFGTTESSMSDSMYALPGRARTVDGWVVGYIDDGYNHGTLYLHGIRGIADYAFAGCSVLSSVSIGDDVVRIGAHAFDGCNDGIYDRTTSPGVLVVDGWAVGLDGSSGDIRLNDVRGIADEAFAWNDLLHQVTMDDYVRHIGNGAFEGSRNLQRIKIGKGVEDVGNNAFAACSEALYDMTTVPGVRVVDGWAVGCTGSTSDILDIAGIRGIADYAFADRSTIASVVLSDGVTHISRGAFMDCASLAEVAIPESVTKIGEYAFDGCNAALYDTETLPGVRLVDGWAIGTINGSEPPSDIVLPEIRGIADYAFRDCSVLTSVTVPSSVVGIGSGAFSGCGSLTNMVLPFVGARRGNSGAPDALFGYIFGTSPYPGGVATQSQYGPSSTCCGQSSGLNEVVYYIPGGLKHVMITDETMLGYGAFSNCARIERVELNKELSEISDNAFSGCSGLKSFTLGEGIERIGFSAFGYCSGLESVTFNEGLSEICDGAFWGCANLRTVTFGENVAYIGYSAFGGCEHLDSVYFLGDAPYAEYDVFMDSSKRMMIYVKPGTTGWASGSSSDLPTRWPEGSIEYYGMDCGRRIKMATGDIPGGNGGTGGTGSGGTSGIPGDGVAGSMAITVTNVVVHYVTQSVPSAAVFPAAADGIVNIVSEVNAGAAVAITEEWAQQYSGFSAKFGNDFAKALTAPTGKTDGTGKSMMVWQDFVAGTDPTNPDDKFTASITFDKDTGEPVISWTPELSAAEAAKRLYKKYGKVRLTDADWSLIDGDASSYNFFKVTVEMK